MQIMDAHDASMSINSSQLESIHTDWNFFDRVQWDKKKDQSEKRRSHGRRLAADCVQGTPVCIYRK